MNVKDAIGARRAYRSLEPVEITEEIVAELSGAAQLAPSCNNNQPWRFVFIDDPELLRQMHDVLTEGNKWVRRASMIVVVLSRKDLDCMPPNRDFYYAFDTGMATAFLILRATELGLVAHPIAGYSPRKTRAILNIPDEWEVITLVNIGKKSAELNELLSENQKEREAKRPERLAFEHFAFRNRFEAEDAEHRGQQ